MTEYYDLLTDENIEKCQLQSTIRKNFNWVKSRPENQGGKDSIKWIGHYMDVLRKYSSKGNISVEFGLNQVNSTWALLASKAKIIHSVDIDVHKRPIQKLRGFDKNIWAIQAHKLAWQNGKEYYIHECSSTEIYFDKIDFLFIDSLHSEEHLKNELKLHAPIVSNHIAIHDTMLFRNAYGSAITDLLDAGDWEIELELKDSPGLTILKRK